MCERYTAQPKRTQNKRVQRLGPVQSKCRAQKGPSFCAPPPPTTPYNGNSQCNVQMPQPTKCKPKTPEYKDVQTVTPNSTFADIHICDITLLEFPKCKLKSKQPQSSGSKCPRHAPFDCPPEQEPTPIQQQRRSPSPRNQSPRRRSKNKCSPPRAAPPECVEPVHEPKRKPRRPQPLPKSCKIENCPCKGL